MIILGRDLGYNMLGGKDGGRGGGGFLVNRKHAGVMDGH